MKTSIWAALGILGFVFAAHASEKKVDPFFAKLARENAIRSTEVMTRAFLEERGMLVDESERLEELGTIYDSLPAATRVESELLNVVVSMQDHVERLNRHHALVELGVAINPEITRRATEAEAGLLSDVDYLLLLMGRSAALGGESRVWMKRTIGIAEKGLVAAAFGIPVALTAVVPGHHWYYGIPEVAALSTGLTWLANQLFNHVTAKKVVAETDNTYLALIARFTQLAQDHQLPIAAARDGAQLHERVQQLLHYWLPCDTLLSAKTKVRVGRELRIDDVPVDPVEEEFENLEAQEQEQLKKKQR